jgi:hypothetical protein
VSISVVITRLKKVSKFLTSSAAITLNLSVCTAPYVQGCRRRIEVVCKSAVLRRAATRLVSCLYRPHAFRRWCATRVSLIRDAWSTRIKHRSASTNSSSTNSSSMARWFLQVPPLRHALAILLALSSAEAAFAQSMVIDEPTIVTLQSSANPAGADASITLTASVTTGQGSGVPGGTIQFIDETTLAVLGWADAATPSITVNNLTAGRHLIRADYSGTADFLPLVAQPSQSESLPLTILVLPDVTLSASPNPCSPGQLVTLTAMVTSKIGTPKGTVTFSDGRSVIAAHVRLDHGGTASYTTMALGDGPRGAVVAVYEGDGEHASAVSRGGGHDAGAVRIRDTLLLGTSTSPASATILNAGEHLSD